MDASTAQLDFTVFHNVINGHLCSTEHTRHGINPATEEINPAVPVSTPSDVNAAVDAALAVFPLWASTPYTSRQEKVLAFADALENEKEQFAQLLTVEQGKPIRFARAEIDSGVAWLRGIAALELKEETIRKDETTEVIIRYTPLGVTVGVVPWNYPVMLACGKMAPALVTGNTFILKPSPLTPYCNLKMAELAQRFFPPGVVQALSGDDNLGPWLTAHPGPAKISFTGSTATGKKVMEAAAKSLKRVTLELGGNDAAIVCRDVDLDAVIPQIVYAVFLNSGQICMAIKRLYVHQSIFDKFRQRLSDLTETLKIGQGEEAVIGPLQNSMQYEKVKDLVAYVKNNQLDVVGCDRPVSEKGYYISPVIVDNPEEGSRVVQEEAFGPIVPLLSWTDEDEVISRVNGTDMGLSASVWSSDVAHAERMARRIEAGTVWVNTHLAIEPTAPFGGYKSSGIGREWGLEGLKECCNLQTLFLKR